MPSNYLAINIPDDIINQISLLQGILQQMEPSFKPDEISRLHITLLYMGQRFKQESKEKLNEFNTNINDNIMNQSYNLVFNKPQIKLFPPGRDELIVVEYNCNNNGHQLFNNMLKYIDDGTHGRESWRPHITLGKVRNKDLDLSPLNSNIDMLLDSSFSTDGFHLVGTSLNNKLSWKF